MNNVAKVQIFFNTAKKIFMFCIEILEYNGLYRIQPIVT